jgi:Leucine-rich repeat (LRR) protein
VTLSISNNNINNIPDEIGNLINISLLDLGHNDINILPTTMGNMTNLEELYVNNNRINILPNELMRCHQLGFCLFTGNLGIVTSHELLTFLDRFINNNINPQPNNNNIFHTIDPKIKIYSSNQSVHASSIQSDIKKSIKKLLKDNSTLDINQVLVLIKIDKILDKKTKNILIKFSEDLTNHHSTLNVTFGDILAAVWEKITTLQYEYQTEVKKIICQEMAISQDKCFTGKISRLVSCLQGFIEGIEIGINKSEQISNIILMVKKKLEKDDELTQPNWIEEFEKEMKNRKYSDKEINEWSQFIEL